MTVCAPPALPSQTSADAAYLARHASLKAGIPIATPALTVNRYTGSECDNDSVVCL